MKSEWCWLTDENGVRLLPMYNLALAEGFNLVGMVDNTPNTAATFSWHIQALFSGHWHTIWKHNNGDYANHVYQKLSETFGGIYLEKIVDTNEGSWNANR